MLNLGGETEEEKVKLLIQAIEDLKKELDIPSTIQEVMEVGARGRGKDGWEGHLWVPPLTLCIRPSPFPKPFSLSSSHALPHTPSRGSSHTQSRRSPAV